MQELFIQDIDIINWEVLVIQESVILLFVQVRIIRFHKVVIEELLFVLITRIVIHAVVVVIVSRHQVMIIR